jgi:hypothetical protein
LHGNGGTQLFDKVFSKSVGEAVESREIRVRKMQTEEVQKNQK